MNLFSDLQVLGLTITSAITSVFALGNMGPEKTPAPSPTPITQATNVVTKTGEYNYAGKNVSYTLNIPKNGGEVTGNISGSCSGPITGIYDGKEGGDIEGSLNATCFFAFIKKSMQVNFSGKLYLEEERADLNWEGEIPLTDNKGSFILNFEPD